MSDNKKETMKTKYYVVTPDELEEQRMIDNYRIPSLRETYQMADRSNVSIEPTPEEVEARLKKVTEQRRENSKSLRGKGLKSSDDVDEQINALKNRIEDCKLKFNLSNGKLGGSMRGSSHRGSNHRGSNHRGSNSKLNNNSNSNLDTASGHNNSSGNNITSSLNDESQPPARRTSSASEFNFSDSNLDDQHKEGQRLNKKDSFVCPVYRFVNINPIKEKLNLEEDSFLELICDNRELCNNYYQFDAFPNDWLPPLHMACCLGFSHPIIKKIYKYYPTAIHYVSDHSGMNVLHYASMYTRSSLKVMNYLIKQYNKSSNNKNDDNNNKGNTIKAWTEAIDNEYHRTPLHMACSCLPSYTFFNSDIILLLTEINDRCIMIIDKYGYTPLHLACLVDCPNETIIDDLITVNSDACMISDKTKTKSIPLHYILSSSYVTNPYNEFIDIVKDLVKANPTSLKVIRHASGGYTLNYLPIYMAIDHNADIKILKLLIKYWPDCLFETDNKKKNGITPYQYAKDRKNITNQHILELLNPYEEE